jgi:hypothetical protein
MTKTPYELRYELLTLAQGILSEKYLNARIKIENDWNMACEKARITLDKGRDADFPPFPSVPCYDDNEVIAMAEKLNKFVSNTGE